MHYFLIFYFFLWIAGADNNLSAQDSIYIIDSIQIIGLKRTKEKVIRREISFKKGDSISVQHLEKRIDRNAFQLMNTGLFSDVKTSYRLNDSLLLIEFKVEEAYPLLTGLILEFADRNFNVWWDEFNADLRRINFGLSFTHKNLNGYADNFKLALQAGFTPKFQLEYLIPQLGSKKIFGLASHFLYSTNKELGYTTKNNLLIFERSEDSYLIRRLQAGLGLSFRPKWRHSHFLNLFFRDRSIADQVVVGLNPDFFAASETRQRYFSLLYQWIWDSRNLRAYPSIGHFLSVVAEKKGIGLFNDINLASASIEYRQYLPINPSLTYESRLKIKGSIIRKQPPYYNYRALGYGEDYLRGYEYYVIDGLDFFYWKQSIHTSIFKYRLKSHKLFSFFSTPSVPLRFYLALNMDVGYVNSPFFTSTNSMINRWLAGFGVGLNILMFYDRLLKFEFTINEFGENGLFLHYKVGF